MTEPQPLLGIDDLARILGLTEKAIYNRRHRRGALPPATRIGRNLRWQAQDVEEWLTEQTEDDHQR